MAGENAGAAGALREAHDQEVIALVLVKACARRGHLDPRNRRHLGKPHRQGRYGLGVLMSGFGWRSGRCLDHGFAPFGGGWAGDAGEGAVTDGLGASAGGTDWLGVSVLTITSTLERARNFSKRSRI